MLFRSGTPRQGLALCVLASLSPSLTAQTGQNGSISGLITGPDKAPIVPATVTLTGIDGFRRTSTATEDGTFSLSDLPSGTYAVQVAAAGFSPSSQSAVPVAVGRTTRLTFPLNVAGSSQTVSVSATQAVIDSAQTSSVVNIDRDRIEELPVPNRNYLSFVALSLRPRPPTRPSRSRPALQPMSPSASAASVLPATQSASTA